MFCVYLYIYFMCKDGRGPDTGKKLDNGGNTTQDNNKTDGTTQRHMRWADRRKGEPVSPFLRFLSLSVYDVIA